MKIYFFDQLRQNTSYIYRINKKLKNFITDCDPLRITFVISIFFQDIALMTNVLYLLFHL